VAVHLELEILLVDEVLAVGDAYFQEKCLGKMKTLSASGSTVIFVSHNMDSIPVLMTVGRLAADERYKGVNEILELMPSLLEEMPHIAYSIVGDGTRPPVPSREGQVFRRS
jgi:lipopolysaccharide transport system ATP-binding protein